MAAPYYDGRRYYRLYQAVPHSDIRIEEQGGQLAAAVRLAQIGRPPYLPLGIRPEFFGDIPSAIRSLHFALLQATLPKRVITPPSLCGRLSSRPAWKIGVTGSCMSSTIPAMTFVSFPSRPSSANRIERTPC
jgi:hypothetical protein